MEEKRKVLFIVYRTEWWGCLDSYCRQECYEQDTLCYVMPVPRYEREDITYKVNFDKIHFHPERLDAVLPEGACMVDYREFSLEQGFDRIYIHNPYDNNSLTDTVELKYYSSNLKTYAKKLIYVSHLMSLLPPDSTNCRVYDYVDAIYVPNEQARLTLDVKYDGKVEVVPSGLPHYLDRLAEKKRINRNDSVNKSEKIKLLYCVSYSDLYHGTEKQLQKMRDIFEYVRRNQDIQLIFRPDEDIRARRGMLDVKVWEEYEQLVAFYKKNRIGIYDESPDLYQAAVEADGIMCTSHPMAALFSVQGKYVLRVDWTQRQVRTTEERCTPAIWSAAVTEKEDELELFFVPDMTKLICRMVIPCGDLTVEDAAAENQSATDIKTANKKPAALKQSAISRQSGSTTKKKAKKHLSGPKVEVVAEVPDEIDGGLNYMFITRAGNCLYLPPCGSNGIWKYDMDTGYFGKAYLPDMAGGRTGGPVSAVFTYGKYLYMMPAMYPGIIKYDTETEEIDVIDGWVGELENLTEKEYHKEPYFSWAAVQEGHMLYLASSQGDVWMEFDMEKDCWQTRPMSLPGMRFVHMVKEGEWVWLFPYCGEDIALWNCESGEGRIICRVENKNMESGIALYLYSLDLGDSIAAFPQRETDHILVLSKKGHVTKLRENLPCSPADCQSEYRRNYGCGYQFIKQLDNGMILAYEYYDGAFLLLDKNLRQLRKVPCRLAIETVRQQQDVRQRNAHCRGGFSGVLSEGYSIPVMLECFVRQGREDRKEIRERYADEYRYPGN